MNKTTIVLGVVAVAGLLVGYGFWRRENLMPVSSNTQSLAESQPLPGPSPLPFQELTIPFLRARRYDSQLGALEPVGNRAGYSSYLTYYTSDGLRINGLLTRPTGEMPEGGWPAIVFVHGYIPPNEYRTQERYVDYVDYLARNGFVVFKIDLRGHGDSEGEATGAYYSGDYIVDTLNAYSALQKTEFVNPAKIGLWGHSMAGNVALRSWAVRTEIPAVVVWAGAVYTYEDFGQFGINGGGYRPPPANSNRARRRQQIVETYGQFDLQHPFWQAMSPAYYLPEMKGAIQLHHAIDDTVVDIGYSRGLTEMLKTTTIPHQLHEYSTGGHNISGGNFGTAMQRTVEFFKQYLDA